MSVKMCVYMLLLQAATIEPKIWLQFIKEIDYTLNQATSQKNLCFC